MDGKALTWSLSAVTRGHFLSADQRRCSLVHAGLRAAFAERRRYDPVTKNRTPGADALVQKRRLDTATCHKLTPPGAGGKYWFVLAVWGAGELYIEDLLNPKTTLFANSDHGGFFDAFDTTGMCGRTDDRNNPSPLTRSHIDKVEFLNRNVQGVPVIAVTARFGKKQMTREDVTACLALQGNIFPSTKAYRMEFFFDGHTFKPSPSSLKSVQIFEDK